jgi:hypothetical protein
MSANAIGIMAINSTRRHRPWGPIVARDWYEYSPMPMDAAEISKMRLSKQYVELWCLCQAERSSSGARGMGARVYNNDVLSNNAVANIQVQGVATKE